MLSREVETKLHAFSASALNASEWSSSHPDHITPGERKKYNPLFRRLGEPQSYVDTERRKYFICE